MRRKESGEGARRPTGVGGSSSRTTNKKMLDMVKHATLRETDTITGYGLRPYSQATRSKGQK